MRTLALRYLLAASLWMTATLSAQTAAPAPATPEKKPKPAEAVVSLEQKEAEAKALELEKVEVTGSRIRTLVGEQTAIPVLSITQAELEHRGVTRLADIRRAIPQLAAAVGFNDNLVNGGPSRAQQVGTSFNLRGLGGNSTLVLVDGRRVPHTGQEAPGGAGGREDFNIDGIPVSAIERIDILPQGAGAIYGAEAIAGVVNIVLKKNYTGAELNVTYDNTFDTDVGQTTVSLTAGYRRNKLSTFLTLSYEDQKALMSVDRWFTAPLPNDTSAFILQQPSSGSGGLASTQNPQNPGQANLPGLTTNVVAIPTGSGGTGVTVADYAAAGPLAAPFNPAQYTVQVDAAVRQSAVFKADYEFAPWLNAYGEVRYSTFENSFTSPPVTAFNISLPVGAPGNPFSTPVFLKKVFWDLPAPLMNSEFINSGAAFGVRGKFLEDWRYDASASWAQNVVKDDQVYTGFTTSLVNAALANPDPALRPILAYDSRRAGGNPNPAGRLESYMPTSDHKDTTDVYQYNIMADGPVWESWAGAWRVAIGGDHSEEKVKFWRQVPNGFSLTAPFSRTMKAAFAEASLPLLSTKQHVGIVHRLDVGAAIRAEDFSDIGSQTTLRYNVLYQPVKWLTFRYSYAEGFKAPRLQDLLGVVNLTGTTNITAASNVRDTRRGGEQIIGVYPRISGGNPNLGPETSESMNYGMVIDVPGPWFKGLSFSVDCYEIDFFNRPGAPSNQILIDFFPERVTRAAPSAADTAAGFLGVITGFDGRGVNLAAIWTQGVDYRVTYQRAFDFGALTMSAALTDSDTTFTQATPTSVPSGTFGHQPVRASGSLFWNKGPWDAGVTVDYQAAYYTGALTSLTPYPRHVEYSPQVSYNFAKDPRFGKDATDWWARALSGGKLSLTIVNLLNTDPAVTATGAPGPIIMDPRLRRYIVALSKKF